MNILPHHKVEALHICFALGLSERESARRCCVNRKTANLRKAEWIEMMLQFAYDLLWDHHGEWCDQVTELLPDKPVIEMLDAWMDDQFEEKKSRWH